MQTELNNSVQKILKRNIAKGEVAYLVKEVVGGYQAQVEIPPLTTTTAAQTIASEVMNSVLEARENAAKLALQTILGDPQLKAIHDTPKPEKPRPPQTTPYDPDAPRHKSKLQISVLKIFRGNLGKDDISYETEKSGSGFVSSVTCKVLPGKMGQKKWTGEVSTDENLAEQSAAEVALKAIMANRQLMAIHDKKQGKGKGKGKGWDIDPFTMMVCYQMGVHPRQAMQEGYKLLAQQGRWRRRQRK